MKITCLSPAPWTNAKDLLDLNDHTFDTVVASGPLAVAKVVAQQPDAVCISGYAADEVTLAALDSINRQWPHAILIAHFDGIDTDGLMACMRSGVRDVITHNRRDDWQSALARAEQHFMQSGPVSGKVMGLVSAKGGDGGTLVTANLAYALAQNPQARVLVLDLSLPFGDLDMYLSTQPSTSDLLDMLQELDRLDRSLMESMAAHATPNLHFVAAPATYERVVQIQPAQVARLVRVASQHYHHVLLDLGSTTNPVSLAAMDTVQSLTVVATAMLPSIRRTGQWIKLWESLDHNPQALSVMVNRFNSETPIAMNEITSVIGRPVARVLPNEFVGAQNGLLRGKTVVELLSRSEFTQTMHTWAQHIMGVTPPKQSLWQRLKNR